jgi:hypothetical protein
VQQRYLRVRCTPRKDCQGMSPHQVIAVAVRLFAVWLGLYVIRGLPAFYVARPADALGIWIGLGIVLVSGGVVLALWLFPGTVAAALLSKPVAESEPSRSPDLWLTMGCALVGLWVMTSAFPAFIRDALVIYDASSNHDEVGGVKFWLFYNAVEVAIAAWLILGAKGFRKVFWWARYAGVQRTT